MSFCLPCVNVICSGRSEWSEAGGKDIGWVCIVCHNNNFDYHISRTNGTATAVQTQLIIIVVVVANVLFCLSSPECWPSSRRRHQTSVRLTRFLCEHFVGDSGVYFESVCPSMSANAEVSTVHTIAHIVDKSFDALIFMRSITPKDVEQLVWLINCFRRHTRCRWVRHWPWSHTHSVSVRACMRVHACAGSVIVRNGQKAIVGTVLLCECVDQYFIGPGGEDRCDTLLPAYRAAPNITSMTSINGNGNGSKTYKQQLEQQQQCRRWRHCRQWTNDYGIHARTDTHTHIPASKTNAHQMKQDEFVSTAASKWSSHLW